MNTRPPEIPPHKLISALRGYGLLPAIIFLPTRRKCDEAAIEVSNDRSQPADAARQTRRREIFDVFVIENPEIKHHKHLRTLLNSGVASHHAGHIPPWKLLIEKMMSGGLLNAIFATSTVAAGVDFPARTVVISNADTRGNDGWRPLRASELQQMTGRAGRRGKDNVGFVILAPGQFQNPKKIAELLKIAPDPLESQFRSTYTSLLNLLDAFGSFAEVRKIALKSFAFQTTARRIDQLQASVNDQLLGLELELAENAGGVTIEDVIGFERLASARDRLRSAVPVTRYEFRHRWLKEKVAAGRVISQGRGGKHLFIVIAVQDDRISVMRDDGIGSTIALERVGRVFSTVYPLKENSIESAFIETSERRNLPLEEPRLSASNTGGDAAADLIDTLMNEISRSSDEATALLWAASSAAADVHEKRREIEGCYEKIWLPFERRAKVLDHFGYIDFRGEQVTQSGKWLADVRVDRTLLVGEAVRRGILNDLLPKALAGIMAALTADADRNYGDLYLSDRLLDVVNEIEDIIYDVSNVEWKFGVEPFEEINLSAAAAAERWAGGMTWDELVRRTNAEEGDLFRLLARTGEALMQIAHLKRSNPAAAELARTTAAILLRDPIR